MIPRIHSLPNLEKNKDAGAGWVGRIAQQVEVLKDILSQLDVGDGLELNVDAMGRIRIELVSAALAGAIENYGFRVWVDDDGDVNVAAGTAQVWGGNVEAYSEQNLGAAHDGYYVYAYADLTIAPPEWESIQYGPMTGQTQGEDLWIPIAKISGSSQDGWSVTQFHWGNIVVPAVANVVDIQQ